MTCINSRCYLKLVSFGKYSSTNPELDLSSGGSYMLLSICNRGARRSYQIVNLDLDISVEVSLG